MLQVINTLPVAAPFRHPSEYFVAAQNEADLGENARFNFVIVDYKESCRKMLVVYGPLAAVREAYRDITGETLLPKPGERRVRTRGIIYGIMCEESRESVESRMTDWFEKHGHLVRGVREDGNDETDTTPDLI